MAHAEMQERAEAPREVNFAMCRLAVQLSSGRCPSASPSATGPRACAASSWQRVARARPDPFL
eukprot:3886330-Pyramimonas_sp.AAC.1